jgi:hypothetical protein
MTLFNRPKMFKQNDLIQLISITNINCPISLSNSKEWTINAVNELTGQIEKQVFIKNNPTINYADLVLQPQTLSYGVYKCVYTVTMLCNANFTSSVETFIKIVPSGLVLSTLKLSQPMFGGTIEINRGQNQQVQFDPFLFTYDIDNVAVISTLSFRYACQVIDSNIPQGYQQIPGTDQIIYLSDIKSNSSLSTYNTCFNSTSILIFTLIKSFLKRSIYFNFNLF